MRHANGASRKIVAKACDACRRRKIKCDGAQPCLPCLSASLSCAFNSPRGQGGNRGARATVLNELRANQDYDDAPDHAQATPSTSLEYSVTTTVANIAINQDEVEACTEIYLGRIHQVVPLLDAETLKAETSRTSTSLTSHQLMLAFCAYVANFGNFNDEPAYSSIQKKYISPGEHFLRAALSTPDLGRFVQPHPESIYISFFLYGAFAGQGNYRQAWFYLRESTTLFMMIKPGSHPWYTEETQTRLFWILVISERAHAVRRNRPITLQVNSGSVSLDVNREGSLHHLASIFRPLDERFFAVWNGSTQECSKDWLLRLERDVRTALPATLVVSNAEIANLRVTQCWLQIKLWELFPRFGFLSTESVYECLTFEYPITVAKDLTVLTMKLPIASMQVHGIGMTEKVFDIACALADVIPFISSPISQVELNPVDYLTQTASLLTRLPGGSTKFVPLLLAKVKELLPELVKTMCEVIQLPVLALNDPMSPGTRYVYEEEVGRALYTDLRKGR